MLVVSPQQKQAIRERWVWDTVHTYHEQTAEFLLREKDEFRNPMGNALIKGLPILLDELLGGMSAAIYAPALEDIIRIRAVQDFAPGQAVGFVFLLKGILRSELEGPVEELTVLEDRIDEMALAGFDLFMKCREKIYGVRADEARRRTDVLERMYFGAPER
jgi:RsbT co-antagonist protein rsbRD N-terminal domain